MNTSTNTSGAVQENDTTSAPSMSVFLTLSPNYPKISAFTSFIGWALITLAIFLVSFFVDKIQVHIVTFPILISISLLSGLFGFYSAKACGYKEGEFELVYKQGLWWKKQTALSFSRIQHIDITHGPLERKYRIATIKFFTAGGAASDLKIPGLPNKTAKILRNKILQYAKLESDTCEG